MSETWLIQTTENPPEWLIQAVRQYAPDLPGHYAAQLLWQRGIQTPEQLAEFVDFASYKPANPFEFGDEMHWAVARLQRARERKQMVAIWGDFDADGITSTAVLWDGLGQFFTQNLQLFYHIPNRLTDSHGLNRGGIEVLANRGIKLIVTCDTGSTNIAEIEYASELGIDIIVTDHHTLPPSRPPVAAIINPRYLASDHRLFNLSGVAVAYKLIEALYLALPDVPQQPLADLLDLVAIGLIADLVELKGDCRYLAKKGIDRLQAESKKPKEMRRRPGVGKLLDFCKKTGDRPTDISFGIGPRINAVSRIQGDASFCVQLLTSRDLNQVEKLAQDTEIANARRKSLQKEVENQAEKKLAQLDLSTTSIIVLAETEWPVGVLGLVAGQIAQKTGLPAILLSIEIPPETETPPLPPSNLARGSARSVNQIDLYQLVLDQAHLLHRFGGHPFAAGLSLPVENIPLFTQAINQRLRQQLGAESGLLGKPVVRADLTVKVAELGKDLFWELRLLDPFGMGNPVPQLLIKNCWFHKIWHKNIQDATGKQVKYIKTTFELWDESVQAGFPGCWWGHYKDEIPPGRCDAIVEIDFNGYDKRYEVRLIAVRAREENYAVFNRSSEELDWILDWRDSHSDRFADRSDSLNLASNPLVVQDCPSSWDQLQMWYQTAKKNHQKLAIAYSPPASVEPSQIWQKLVGIAKYLSRTGKIGTYDQIQEKLDISKNALYWGLQSLRQLGFEIYQVEAGVKISGNPAENIADLNAFPVGIAQFYNAIREEQFRRQYFASVPLSVISYHVPC